MVAQDEHFAFVQLLMHACPLASCANVPRELQCRTVEGVVGAPRLRPTPGPSGAAVAGPGVSSAYCLVRP